MLRLSPRLLTEPSYLEPYPALTAFLAEHPDIAQNPGFYFGTASSGLGQRHGAARRARAVGEMFAGFAVFAGLMTLLGVFAWLLRSMIDHQRWKRALKVQAEAHTKLLERLSSTEEVLAYAQSPAGRHFLESGAPLEARAARRQRAGREDSVVRADGHGDDRPRARAVLLQRELRAGLETWRRSRSG